MIMLSIALFTLLFAFYFRRVISRTTLSRRMCHTAKVMLKLHGSVTEFRVTHEATVS